MAWPPNPNKTPTEHNRANNTEPTTVRLSDDKAWKLLEKTLTASLEEQRKARKWNTFFKVLTFAYLFILIAIMGRGCMTSDKSGVSFERSQPHLAVVQVKGVISADTPANSADINEAMTAAFEDTNAKAVVLDINSPGGSPVQSDEIWRTAMALRQEHPDKKLYAVIGDTGASGAYYIAAGADEIWVNPSSIVGSIGVIMPSYNIERLLDKAGVEDHTMTSGEYKDILSMSRPMTDEERTHVNTMLATVHQNFIDAVKEGRGDKLKDVDANKTFSGLFWSGKQAIEIGLADKAGSIFDLRKELDVEYVVDYTPRDPMQDLFDRFGIQFGKGVGATLGDSVISNVKEQSLKVE